MPIRTLVGSADPQVGIPPGAELGLGAPMRTYATLIAFLLLAAPAGAIEVHVDRSLIPPDMPPRVRAAVEKLYSPEKTVQLEGANALGALGEEAAAAAPFLVTLLWGKTDIHRAAAQALIRIGKPAVEPVVMALQVAENRYIFGNLMAILEQLRDERATEALAMRYYRIGDQRSRNILAAIGPLAVDRLLAMLGSPNDLWRAAAAKALALAPTARVCEALARAAGDEDPQVRSAALETLGTLVQQSGGALRPPLDVVRAAAKDADGGTRRGALAIMAALTLLDQENFVAELVEAFRDQDRGVRLTALQAIAAFAAEGKLKDHREILEHQALPALTEALGDPDPAVRGKAVEVTALLGQKELLGILQAQLRDENGQVRVKAILALGQFRTTEALPAIAAALKDADSAVRVAAAETLGEMGDRSAEAALQAATEDDDEEVSAAAKKALAELRAEPPPAEPAHAVDSAKRRRRVVRQEAPPPQVKYPPPMALEPPPPPPAGGGAGALARPPTGEGARGSLPKEPERPQAADTAEKQALLSLLNGKGAREREAAVLAAAKMADKGCVALMEALQSDRAGVRAAAASVIARNKLGAAAPGLLEGLGDRDRNVNEEVQKALAALKDDPIAIQALRAAAADGRLRERALGALGYMGSPAASAALAAALQDPDWRTRRLAVENLGRAKAVALVLTALKDPYWYVRVAAAEALGEAGSREAVPALIEALGDEHWYVRRAAHAALGKLTGAQLPADAAAWRAWWEKEGKGR